VEAALKVRPMVPVESPAFLAIVAEVIRPSSVAESRLALPAPVVTCAAVSVTLWPVWSRSTSLKESERKVSRVEVSACSVRLTGVSVTDRTGASFVPVTTRVRVWVWVPASPSETWTV
jgi:hypothetical protein